MELCFQFQAPNKLSLGYGHVMMKAIRGDSTEMIGLIFLYIVHYSGIYFVCICMKKTMKEANEKHSNKNINNIHTKTTTAG